MVTSVTEQSWLNDFIGRYPHLLIVTGAGCSTQSGIPAYRDKMGNWLGRTPIKHQEFIDSVSTRRRYWARSMVGWPNMRDAEPNGLHRTISQWEREGRLGLLITQNVDGLHRYAGSHSLVELHGRIDRVHCLQCGSYFHRDHVQAQLEALNADLLQRLHQVAVNFRPDGDAEFGPVNYNDLICPPCDHCGGDLMPDVVFFGGSVPRGRVQRCEQAVQDADAVLVLGSTLMVYSSYRFCRLAAQLDKPIAIVNQGVTRADDLAQLKVELECVAAIESANQAMLQRMA